MTKKDVSENHCFYCFDVLEAFLENKPIPKASFPDDAYPLFITWHSKFKGHRELRGCIGNFHPLPLRKGLQQYALTSALNDRRFSPIELTEMPHLDCAVSLLTDFELAKDYLDWDIGKHGIWIEFSLVDDDDDNNILYGRRRRRSSKTTTTATYLPEVIGEQGWTKEEAIDSLLRKGGYHRHITEAKRKSIILTRYQSQKITRTYADYRTHCALREGETLTLSSGA
ncbi:AMMECR1 domain-containing protein [Halteromyces radiatus]|uniref:AMMECR1 domain-containing protein n=1 Tax=Halteromyces radiatus TaxID=101107 RepID=UPI00221F694C|nr:AMMECR1 domain-containing protein [Halteromyces radiatus]KAI8090053.1 AMMECR1 domain-containing protein [Halteromyces radiatus]